MSSNLPEIRRLLREDFQDVEGEWIERLISPINAVNEQVYAILDNSLTIDDNIVGDIYKTTFTTSPSYTASKVFTPISVPWNNTGSPRIVIIGQIIKYGSDDVITSPIQITDWRIKGPGVVSIRFISGLSDSTKYTMTILML